jgi:hypothetical protein
VLTIYSLSLSDNGLNILPQTAEGDLGNDTSVNISDVLFVVKHFIGISQVGRRAAILTYTERRCERQRHLS